MSGETLTPPALSSKLSALSRHLRDLPERFGVVHREVGQHLPVHLDAGLLEPRHEAAVAQAVQARRGIDAGDPEGAEVALLLAPVAVRIAHPALHVFLGRLVELLSLIHISEPTRPLSISY